MKRVPLFVAMLATTVLVTVMLGSCSKEDKTFTERSVSASMLPPPPLPPMTLSGVLGTGHTNPDVIHLTNSFVWHLSGLVYVDDQDILIIDPGTTIIGDVSTGPSVPGGGLVITPGAKIMAEGTASNPIIFTSDAVMPVSGDWCGVIIIGKASSNHSSPVTVEGLVNTGFPNVTYGGSSGTNDADNSGILKYVRIEYAGYELSVDNEINGLTLAGVGSGTTINFVEVFKAADDAFQFLGGTVNASHLLAVDALDDMFDTEYGYRGTVSYGLGLADVTRADKSTSNGIECDNNAIGMPTSILTNPVFNFITLIGLPNQSLASITNGLPSGTGKYGRAAHLRRNSQFSISNSIAMGYNYGFSLDQQSGTTSGTFIRNYVHAFIIPFLQEMNGTVYTAIPTPVGNFAYLSVNPNANILLANPFSRSSINNFMPLAISPARTAGAFPTGNTTWANGWSRIQ